MNLYNKLAQLLRSLFIICIIFTTSNQVTGAQSPQDSVKIDILSSTSNNDQKIEINLPEQSSNYIPKPIIDKNPGNGEFEILFTAVNLTPNKKQQISSTSQGTPLSLLLFFEDNRKLRVVVKTSPFRKLDSYYSIAQNKYIFEVSYSDARPLFASSTKAKQDNQSQDKLLSQNTAPAEQEPQITPVANQIDPPQQNKKSANISNVFCKLET